MADTTTPRLILVTGPPRSGTTAVGRYLSLDRSVSALHEPFNAVVGLTAIDRYFEVVGGGGFTAADLDAHVAAIRRLRLSFKPGVFPRETGFRRAAKRLVGGRAVNSYRQCRLNPFLKTIVWKDPFACFLVDDLARRHDVDAVVTVRNPWAVAASFKRMDWSFDIADLQSRLAEAGLADVDNGLANGTPTNSAALNGAALWHLIYAPLIRWKETNPRIHFLNLDDVVADPVATYAGLYRDLGLAWGADKEAKIADAYQSKGGRAMPKSGTAHDRQIDVRVVNTYWRKVLGEAETEQVDALDGPLWAKLSAMCAA